VEPMPAPLWRILKAVSRSFALSLAILPKPLRQPLALAYLLARAADTITDTRIVPRPDRLFELERIRRAVEIPGACCALAPNLLTPQTEAERQLLEHLPAALALLETLSPEDRAGTQCVVLTLIQGMAQDLHTFPGEDATQLAALQTFEDLERYTYFAAGCVGEFWTDMVMAHRPSCARWDGAAMRRLGVGFGRALQMTNVLRDLPRDLRIGRCYLPLAALRAAGLEPSDLLQPVAHARLRPVVADLLRLTLSYYDAAWTYIRAIPRREGRLRLACLWPLLIGLRTLGKIGRADNLLDPGTVVKIPRRAVYAVILESGLRVGSNTALGRRVQAWRQRARLAAG
jgi:farnesyl-diphosphate farnesyltransferase